MGVGVPGEVRITPGRQPLADLYRDALARESLSHSWEAEQPPPLPDGRLTSTELQILQRSLLEVSVHWQAKMDNVSIKTIYSHRRKALEKFGCRGMMDLLKMFSA